MHDASPWIASYTGTFERSFRKLAYLLIDVPCLKCVHRVIAVSPALRDEAQRLGTDESRATFIPNGVEIPAPRAQTSTMRATSRYGLFVGQLVSRKNVELLLEAAKRLTDLELRFIVVGDGPARSNLIELARHLGVEKKVSFTGYVNQDTLSNYYKLAEFFVFPSIAEGLSLSLFEAMSYGLPAIVTRLNVYEGLLQDRVNCLLFNRGDVRALENLIRRVDSDNNLSTEIAENAASLVRDRFSWEVVSKQVFASYEHLLAETASKKSFIIGAHA
jgi:glycosyltransferase involved in cell wall biosynthesis